MEYDTGGAAGYPVANYGMVGRKRFWEVDFARGIAVVLMVLFNWTFAIKFLGIYSFDWGWLYWFLLPRLIGGSFIFLAGVSLRLTHNSDGICRKHVLRGVKIFLIGIGITVLTSVLYPQNTIFFGVLHLIGLSIMISTAFLKRPEFALLVGSIILIIGFYLQSFSFVSGPLFWAGFSSPDSQTFDYWPLLPWLGVMLFGVFFGSMAKKSRNAYVINRYISPVCLLGRHSLAVYIAHQPIFLFILALLGFHVF